METSLHQQLKSRYAGDTGDLEVVVGPYRIDVVDGDQLIEIQHGSLSAIRDKVATLLLKRKVLVVKPILATKLLVKLNRKGGDVVERRRSPKKGHVLDLFHELIYFTRTFPHPNLTIETLLVDVEEWRYPRTRPSRRGGKYQVQDQKLLSVREARQFRTANDLLGLLPESLPPVFDTERLAELLGVQRWVAQRIAYCLRKTGAVQQIGKNSNSVLYEIHQAHRRAA